MSPDWAKIRKEYLKGGTSYRKLAEKHGVPTTAIYKKGKAEGWPELRKQTERKAAAKTVEKLADLESEADTRVYNAAMLLMDCLEASVKAVTAEGDAMTADTMRGYTSSLRAIQQVLASRPTQRDIDEQMARIEKLRKEARADEQENEEVEIVFEGDIKEWAG